MKFLVKKEQIMEIVFLLFTLVSIALVMVIAAVIYNKIGIQFHSTEMATTMSNASLTAYDKFNVSWHILDNIMPFIVIGLTILLLFTSFLIPVESPAYLVINLIGFAFLVFLGKIYANVFAAINIASEDMGNITTTYYPITNAIMTNLPYIAAALVLLVTIVTYTKRSGGL